MNRTNEYATKKYRQLSLKEQILKRPDTYLGSTGNVKRKIRGLSTSLISNDDSQNNENYSEMFKDVITDTPEAVISIFKEVLSNAADNIFISKFGSIFVDIEENGLITVVNGGKTIPMKYCTDKKNQNVYIPEFIFSRLLSSTNYDDKEERKNLGKNNYGVKLVNIFSSEFEIEIRNKNHIYRQRWENNMSLMSEPLIQEADKISKFDCYVKVSYLLDFKRFEMNGYSENDLLIFKRLCVDTSFSTKTEVTFNGESYSCSKISDYLPLFFGDQIPEYVSYIQNSDSYIPDKEIHVINCSGGKMVSFISGAEINEGIHVTPTFKAFGDKIIESINSGNDNRSSSEKKGSKKNIEISKAKITITDFRNEVMIICCYRLINCSYTSQGKSKLDSYYEEGMKRKLNKFKLTIDDNSMKKIRNQMDKWNLRQRLLKIYEERNLRLTSKYIQESGKGKSIRSIKKLEDAYYAGKKPEKCTLNVVEGLSAASYPIKLLSNVKGGRKFNGIYPLTGKPLNALRATLSNCLLNREIQELTSAIGLTIGADYSLEQERAKLRYHRVILIADSDADGKHIIGLVINIFHVLYPSLFETNNKISFLGFMRTPIIRTCYRKAEYKFFSTQDFDAWRKSLPSGAKFKTRYLKGLGSSTDKDIQDDSLSPFNVYL